MPPAKTSPLEHVAAIAGLHSNSKSVRLLLMAVIWLERALHRSGIPFSELEGESYHRRKALRACRCQFKAEFANSLRRKANLLVAKVLMNREAQALI